MLSHCSQISGKAPGHASPRVGGGTSGVGGLAKIYRFSYRAELKLALARRSVSRSRCCKTKMFAPRRNLHAAGLRDQKRVKNLNAENKWPFFAGNRVKKRGVHISQSSRLHFSPPLPAAPALSTALFHTLSGWRGHACLLFLATRFRTPENSARPFCDLRIEGEVEAEGGGGAGERHTWEH